MRKCFVKYRCRAVNSFAINIFFHKIIFFSIFLLFCLSDCLAVQASSFVFLQVLLGIINLLLIQSQIFNFRFKLFHSTEANKISVQACCDMRCLEQFWVQAEGFRQVFVTLQTVLLMIAGENLQSIRYNCSYVNICSLTLQLGRTPMPWQF